MQDKAAVGKKSIESAAGRDFFWNTAGSLCYALMSMVLAFFVMHTEGAEDGGIFGFGFSTYGQQMFIVAYFGIRPFQITDVKREYSFGEYKRMRLHTSLLAAGIAALHLSLLACMGQYTGYKALCIGLLAAYKIFDGYGDVYEAEFQRDGKLYLAGKLLFFRTLFCGGAFMLILLFTHDLLLSCALSALLQFFCMLLYRETERRAFLAVRNRSGAEKTEQNTAETDARGIGGLFVTAPEHFVRAGKERALFSGTVLLFLSVFLDFYVFSAAKYAVDSELTDAANGIFNLLFMPTSVIYLVANFVIKPFMTYLAKSYEDRDFSKFTATAGKLRRFMLGLLLLALALTLLLGGFVLRLGEFVLGGAYAGALSAHKTAFTLIILGGGAYALANLQYYLLVIMRRQNAIFFVYAAAAVLAFFAAPQAVRAGGLLGAACCYMLLMCALYAAFFALSRKYLGEEKRACAAKQK